MIELRLWAALDAFAREGTLSAAARTLHISQPALSQSMKQLETELGLCLFERTGRNRIALNETGKLAAAQATRILNTVKDAEEAIRASAHLQIGVIAPLPQWKLEEVFPDALFTLCEDDKTLISGLLSSRFRLIVTRAFPDQDSILARPLLKERIALAVPCSHPLASRSEISLKDLSSCNLILHRSIGFWYSLVKERIPEARFMEIDDFSAFLDSAGVGAFPYFIIETDQNHRDDVKILPITDGDIEVQYYLCARQDDTKAVHLLETTALTDAIPPGMNPLHRNPQSSNPQEKN